MSKAAIALIAIKNVLVFNNTNEKVQFFAKKGERVTATMSGFETGKYDVKLLAAASKEALNYYRVQANADGEFVNGALFPTKKKNTANSPDYYGQLEVDGVTVARLSAWKKTGAKAGEFLSISIQEPQASEPAAEPAEAAAAAAEAAQ